MYLIGVMVSFEAFTHSLYSSLTLPLSLYCVVCVFNASVVFLKSNKTAFHLCRWYGLITEV